MQKRILIIIGIIMLLAIIGGALLLLQKPKTSTTNVQNSTTQTANWKTFANDNCGGYQLQYPNNWFVDSSNKSDIYVTPDLENARAGVGMQIITDTVTGASLQQIAKTKYGKEGVDFNQSPMKIGGVDALKITTICQGVGCGAPEWIFIKNNCLFNVTSGLDSDKLGSNFDQILSTFRFTDSQNQTANSPSCHENSKYFVISKDVPNAVGTYILVKYKKDYSQPIPCTYVRGNADDIEFKSGTAQYFLALTDNFLILDSGTAPEPRGLTAFDLVKKQGVYNDSYAKPISTSGDTITYWNPTNQKVTPQNCPQGNEWLSQGLPPIIESHVTLNLLDLTKKESGEYRCVPTQG